MITDPSKRDAERAAPLALFLALVCGLIAACAGLARGQGISNPITVANVAALKALPAASFPTLLLLGYYTAGDGGGDPIVWDGTISTAPDSCTVWKPNSGPSVGRWRRLWSGKLNVKGCGVKGDGVTNNDVRIAAGVAAVAAAGSGILYFPAGQYLVTRKITDASNVSFLGDGPQSVITGSQLGNSGTDSSGNQNYPYIDLWNVSNVTVEKLKVMGNGSWTSTPFANPYGGGNSVGFTNHDAAIRIRGTSFNIQVSQCEFTGLDEGLYCYGDSTAKNIRFLNNYCHNIGRGNVIQKASGFVVNANQIDSVMGNMTAAGSTDTGGSKFADPIYIERSIDGTVTGNKLYYFIRIGIVLEGDGILKNRNIAITGNSIRRGTRCRGTEFNAGIWSEGGMSLQPIAWTNNTIDSMGQNSVNGGLGVLVHEVTISGGSIRNCTLQGIGGGGSNLSGVRVQSCKFGADVANSDSTQSMIFDNCVFEGNNNGGLTIEHGKGNYILKGNTFIDNGKSIGIGTSYSNFGIRINQYNKAQRVAIQGNHFYSTASTGDTSGQLYAILGVSGGDTSRTTDEIIGNEFVFKGTLASYPTIMDTLPTEYAFDNTAGTIFKRQFSPYNGNWTQKMPRLDLEAVKNAGTQRCLGWASAAPVSGTYRQGDYYLNQAMASDQGILFLCTVSGTPGTWEERVWGNTIRTGGLRVNGTLIDSSAVMAILNTGLIQSFAVGTPSSQPSGNSESLDLGHLGTSGGIIKVTNTGTGVKRPLVFNVGGGTAATFDTSKGFNGVGNFSVNTNKFTVDASTGNVIIGGTTTLSGSLVSSVGGGYEEKTFTGTVTGCASSPTVTVQVIRVGKKVSLLIPGVTCTSNATGFTLTGMPSDLFPGRTVNQGISEIEDNGSFYLGGCSINTSGIITFSRTTSLTGGLTASWTNTGTKGLSLSNSVLNYIQL